MGSIKKCRVNISVYFAVMIACIMVLDHTGLIILALFCAAFHEAGHFIALWLLKTPVEEVSFRIFGINIRLEHNTQTSYRQEILIALSGCAANFICAAAALLVARTGFFVKESTAFFSMNLALALFNLLPIGPLDGGRALGSFLFGCLHYETAFKIIDAISILFIIPLTVVGFYLVVWTGYNFSLIVACVYLIICVFCKGRLIEIS